jgi:hypothetical protein
LPHSFNARNNRAGCWWLTPVIREAEIRRIVVPSQLRQIVQETPISKIPSTEKGWWNDLPRKPEAFEFKLQYHHAKKKKRAGDMT